MAITKISRRFHSQASSNVLRNTGSSISSAYGTSRICLLRIKAFVLLNLILADLTLSKSSVRSFKCDNFFNKSAYSPSSLSCNESESI